MRIKMLKTMANPKRTMDAGKFYTVDDKLARDLVKAKAAEYVEQPMEKAVKAPEPEKAVISEPEAKPKHVGGGWYETADGHKVRKSELESG